MSHKEPKTNRTVGQLLTFNRQIEHSLEDIFTLMDGAKMARIREFFHVEGERIKSWSNKLSELAKEYLVLDANGDVVMEGEGQAAKPKMVDGKLFEDYIKARNLLLNTSIPCHY